MKKITPVKYAPTYIRLLNTFFSKDITNTCCSVAVFVCVIKFNILPVCFRRPNRCKTRTRIYAGARQNPQEYK